MPPIDLPPWLRAVLNVLAWPTFSVAVGFWASRRPASAFAAERWWSRIRPWEVGGRAYERRLRIKAWKDRLPEAGALFGGGGLSKRALPPGTDRRAGLERYVVETRRAEWVHWVLVALAPVFLVWNDPWVLAVMAVFAAAANGPCLAVQRYNRARAQSALGRARATR